MRRASLVVLGLVVGFYLEPLVIRWLQPSTVASAPTARVTEGLDAWHWELADDAAQRSLALVGHYALHWLLLLGGPLPSLDLAVPLALWLFVSLALNVLVSLPPPADPLTSGHEVVEWLVSPVLPLCHGAVAPRLTLGGVGLVVFAQRCPRLGWVIVAVTLGVMDAFLLVALHHLHPLVLVLSLAPVPHLSRRALLFDVQRTQRVAKQQDAVWTISDPSATAEHSDSSDSGDDEPFTTAAPPPATPEQHPHILQAVPMGTEL